MKSDSRVFRVDDELVLVIHGECEDSMPVPHDGDRAIGWNETAYARTARQVGVKIFCV